MGQWGSMKQAGRGMPVVAAAVGNYTSDSGGENEGRRVGRRVVYLLANMTNACGEIGNLHNKSHLFDAW